MASAFAGFETPDEARQYRELATHAIGAAGDLVDSVRGQVAESIGGLQTAASNQVQSIIGGARQRIVEGLSKSGATVQSVTDSIRNRIVNQQSQAGSYAEIVNQQALGNQSTGSTVLTLPPKTWWVCCGPGGLVIIASVDQSNPCKRRPGYTTLSGPFTNYTAAQIWVNNNPNSCPPGTGRGFQYWVCCDAEGTEVVSAPAGTVNPCSAESGAVQLAGPFDTGQQAQNWIDSNPQTCDATPPPPPPPPPPGQCDPVNGVCWWVICTFGPGCPNGQGDAQAVEGNQQGPTSPPPILCGGQLASNWTNLAGPFPSGAAATAWESTPIGQAAIAACVSGSGSSSNGGGAQNTWCVCCNMQGQWAVAPYGACPVGYVPVMCNFESTVAAFAWANANPNVCAAGQGQCPPPPPPPQCCPPQPPPVVNVNCGTGGTTNISSIVQTWNNTTNNISNVTNNIRRIFVETINNIKRILSQTTVNNYGDSINNIGDTISNLNDNVNNGLQQLQQGIDSFGDSINSQSISGGKAAGGVHGFHLHSDGSWTADMDFTFRPNLLDIIGPVGDRMDQEFVAAEKDTFLDTSTPVDQIPEFVMFQR